MTTQQLFKVVASYAEAWIETYEQPCVPQDQLGLTRRSPIPERSGPSFKRAGDMSEELKAILKRSNEKFRANPPKVITPSEERLEEIEMEMSAAYFDRFIDA